MTQLIRYVLIHKDTLEDKRFSTKKELMQFFGLSLRDIDSLLMDISAVGKWKIIPIPPTNTQMIRIQKQASVCIPPLPVKKKKKKEHELNTTIEVFNV